MKSTSGKNLYWFVPLVLVVLALGYYFSDLQAQRLEQRARQDFLAWLRSAAMSIDVPELQLLEGTPQDEVKAPYRRLKDRLADLRATRPDVRFLYVVGRRSNGVFFYADSEPETSEAESKPGDLYEEATGTLQSVFFRGVPQTEDPMKDHWGTWVSGYAPLRDPENLRVTALLCADVDHVRWKSNTFSQRVEIWSIVLLTVTLLTILFVLLMQFQRAADRLAASEERFRDIAEHMSDWIWEIDIRRTYTYCSPQVEKCMGYTADEMAGKTPFDFMPPHEVDRMRLLLDLVFDQRQTFRHIESWYVRKDGGAVCLLSSGAPMYDELGIFKGYRGIATDDTEKRLVEDDIGRRERVLAAAATVSNYLLSFADFDQGMSLAIKELGRAIDMDCACVFENYSDSATSALSMRERCKWERNSQPADTGRPELQEHSYEERFPSWRESLAQGMPVSGLVKRFPGPERAFFESRGAVSVLIVPIVIGKQFWGFIGFEDCRTERVWNYGEMSILLATAANIGSAIVRKQDEDVLAALNARLQSVLAAATEVSIVATDSQGVITLFNPGSERMLGYSTEEIVGKKTPLALHLPDEIEAWERRLSERTGRPISGLGVFAESTREEGFWQQEWKYVRKDGRPLDVLLTVTPVRGEPDRVTGYLSVALDITERKRAEEMLQKSYENQRILNRLLAISLEDASLRQELDHALGVLLDIPWFETLPEAGVFLVDEKRKELILTVQRGMTPEDAERCRRIAFGQCLCGRAAATGEMQIADSADERHEIRHEPGTPHGHVCVPIRMTGSDRILGVLVLRLPPEHQLDRHETAFLESVSNTLSGIIQRKQAEETLRLFESAVRQVVDIIVITRPELDKPGPEIVFVNPAFTRTTGYTSTEAIGKSPRILQGVKTNRRELDRLRKTLSQGLSFDGDFVNYRKDGSEYAIDLHITPIRNESNEITHFVAIQHDVTDRKAAEEALALARAHEQTLRARIQETLLLGQIPDGIEGLSVAKLSIASQEIDGDFYDFVRHSSRYLDVIVGDIMGKGTTAALLGAATKSHFLRAMNELMAETGGEPAPAAVVNAVHRVVTPQFARPDIGLFVTLCYARFDTVDRVLTFVDCGHTKTIHFRRRDDVCVFIEGPNVPLGVLEGEVYEQVAVPFGAGDVFLFYSDGVTEARNRRGEFFGEQRVADCVRLCARMEPDALIAKLVESVRIFAGSNEFRDDLTCVAVRIEASRTPVLQREWTIPSTLSQLAPAREFVRAFCEESSPLRQNEDELNLIELGFVEALTNVIRHAFGEREDGEIRIAAAAFDDRVQVALYHRGEPFDPPPAQPPDIEEWSEGGRGLYIIENCFDEVVYSRSEDGTNTVSMTKRFDA